MPELKFSRMGGVGVISCQKCDFTEIIVSSMHGVNGFTKGYQCCVCHKFTDRSFTEPFPKNNYDGPDDCYAPIATIDEEFRSAEILSTKKNIRHLEYQLLKQQTESFAAHLQTSLEKYRERLAEVSQVEIEQLEKAEDAAWATFAATLFCDCGERLESEAILICPQCHATDMKYKTTSIS